MSDYPKVIHVSIGGPMLTICVEGKPYYFEMHRYCGPMPLNKNETERKTPWPKKVWEAVQRWCDQGERTGDDDLCVYDTKEVEPPPSIDPEHGELLDMTRLLDCHPEGYEGPCLCRTCLDGETE